jgi:hypothetical protein
LLGIIEELKLYTSHFTVDYALPVESVYCTAVSVIATQRKDSSFLSLVRRRDRRKYHKLPSWCPDFSQDGYLINILDTPDTYWKTRHEQKIEFINERHLVVEGFCCDVANTPMEIKRPSEVLRMALKVCPPINMTRVEYLWRTLVMDSFDTSLSVMSAAGLFFPCVLSFMLHQFIVENSDSNGDTWASKQRLEEECHILEGIISDLIRMEPLCEPYLPNITQLRDDIRPIWSLEELNQATLVDIFGLTWRHELDSIPARESNMILRVNLVI